MQAQKSIKLIITALIYFAWVVIFAVYNYQERKSELYDTVDHRLELAARNFDNILPKNFHHKDLDENSMSKEEDLAWVKVFNKFSSMNDIYYVYSMILKDGKIRFIASDAKEEDIIENSGGFYYFHYDDAADHVYHAFNNKKPTFHNLNDQWGNFRTVLVPFTAEDGTVYVIGADITIDYIAVHLQEELVKTLFISACFLIAFMPFFFVYTSKIKQSEMLESQIIIAEQANENKSKFLTTVSHELRTPMNAIMGFGHLLEIDDSLTDEQKDSVEQITFAGNQMIDLIDDILDLSAIEMKKLNCNIADVELNKIVSEALKFVKPLACQNKIEIINEIAEKSNHIVHVDHDRLRQVIINLLSNAIKYNSENGKVTLTCEEININYLCIDIIDTGQGISKKEMKSLFKPFTRIGKYRGIDGLGVGLVISKNLIELMGGEIGVESIQNVGSRFYFKIPLAKYS